MGYHDNRQFAVIGRKPRYRVIHAAFGIAVERRGGLIEEQHVGIAIERTGYAYTLTLAARGSICSVSSPNATFSASVVSRMNTLCGT